MKNCLAIKAIKNIAIEPNLQLPLCPSPSAYVAILSTPCMGKADNSHVGVFDASRFRSLRA